MLLYISILGIFLSIVLLYFNARKSPSTIYLAIFCFLVSLYSVNQYLILYSKSEFWISVLFTNISFLSYLAGPMCYWYIRSILTDDARLKKRDIFHFIPFLVHLTACLPYIFTPYSYKLETARSIIADSDFLGNFHATYLSDLFSNQAVYLSRPILLLFYILWSIGLFISFKTKREKAAILFRHHFMNKWLMFFLGFLLLLVSSHLIILFRVFQSNMRILLFTTNLLQSLSFVGLIGLLITPFFFPQILYGLPNFSSDRYETESKNGTTQITRGLEKKVPGYEFDYILSIIQKMAICMQEQQPYLHPDFNLAQFSVLIQVPAHHLSYFFREVKRQSFHDYCNQCRIEHSKRLIVEGKAEELTLEAIGLLSGFATRNTFFTAFKRAEGIAPSLFAAKVSENLK